jgi:hypothetical protein
VKRNITIVFPLFVGLVTLLTFILNMINGRFWLADFRVYYCAAQQLVAGGQVYMVSFHEASGYFKYCPSILYFFLPYTLLNYKIAAGIHFFILGFTYWYTFTVFQDLLKKYIYKAPVKYGQLLLCLAFICILIHFSREMYLGNINILMLLLCCLAIRNYLDGRTFRAGLFLGLAILTKPYFIILLLPMILRRKWGSLSGLLTVLLTGLVLPFLYPGPVKGLVLFSEWLKSMFIHNRDFPDMNSVEYLLRYYLFPAIPGYIEYIIIVTACVLATLLILANHKREQKSGNGFDQTSGNILFEWFILLAMLPTLLRTDWVMFLISAPLITFMIFFISSTKKYLLIPVMIILMFFFGANSDDLLGREFSRKLLEMGIMGLSNIVLIAIATGIFMTRRSETDH